MEQKRKNCETNQESKASRAEMRKHETKQTHVKSLGRWRIIRVVRLEAGSNNSRGFMTPRRTSSRGAGCARRGPRRRLIFGGPAGMLPVPCSALLGGSVGGARAAVAGGRHGSGNDDGRDVVGEIGGLVATSTDRGDGSLATASSPATGSLAPRDAGSSFAAAWPPAAACFAKRDAVGAPGRGAAGRCNRGGTSRRGGGGRAPGTRPVRTEREGCAPTPCDIALAIVQGVPAGVAIAPCGGGMGGAQAG
jgi:hypothetical protein